MSNNQNDTVIKQKRGRKPKNINILQSNNQANIIDTFNNIISNNDNSNDDNEANDDNDATDMNNNATVNLTTKPLAKKRGRKPKGGKIVQQITTLNNNKEVKPNVILHLKCSLKDLQTNILNSNVESYNFSSNKNDLSYEIIENSKNDSDNIILNSNCIPETEQNNNTIYEEETDDAYFSNNKENETKEIWKKLKQLEHNLHINNINNKKSACFWCTYDFDNPPIYIPKYHIKNSYHVYGCFCSPECGVAYLMDENIDSSSKFERYYLINHIYSKIYDYKKNIKPAPNPYYMLEKYYGNLSIQEYRSLLKNERLFLIIEKPLTRILPELHEDNDDFIINNKIIPSNNYQIRKKLQKKTQSKNNIVSEKFGIP
jgi:hypothetical protein